MRRAERAELKSPMAQKPVDKEVARRFAELVGSDLTQHEAAGAVAIGTRTGERLMTKPEIRQIVAETRAARSRMGDGDPEILALLGPLTKRETRTGSAACRAPSFTWRAPRAAHPAASCPAACFASPSFGKPARRPSQSRRRLGGRPRPPSPGPRGVSAAASTPVLASPAVRSAVRY